MRSPIWNLQAKFTLREPHSWDPRQWTTWSRVVTSDFNSVFLCICLLSCAFVDVEFFAMKGDSPIPEHHHFTFFGGFCRSGDYHLKNFFNFNPFITPHGRLSPNAKHSAAPRVSGRSGDSHFHTQNGSSSFRSPAFSCSKRLKLVPEPRILKLKTAQARSGAHFHARPRARSGALAHFSLCRSTYLPKFGVSTPPPPPRGDMQTVELGQTSIVLATPLSIICLYLATHLSQSSQNC